MKGKHSPNDERALKDKIYPSNQFAANFIQSCQEIKNLNLKLPLFL